MLVAAAGTQLLHPFSNPKNNKILCMDAEYYMGDNKNQTQEDDVVTHGTKKYNNRRNKHKKKHEKIQIYRRKSYRQGTHTIYYCTDKRGRNGMEQTNNRSINTIYVQAINSNNQRCKPDRQSIRLRERYNTHT